MRCMSLCFFGAAEREAGSRQLVIENAMRSAPLCIQIFVDEIHVVMRRTAAAAVLCNGLALKRTFNDLAAVADVCREYRAVQVTPQPFLALTFAVGVLEAGNKTSEQVQAGVQLLTRDLNLLLQLIQAVKRIRVNLNRNNDLIRCDQRIDDADIDIMVE